MGSDDSDDEPLSLLANSNRITLVKIEEDDTESNATHTKGKIKKKKKKMKKQKMKLKISPEKLNRLLHPQTIQRPMDVWLYLKDLSPNGPYSCLLCSEWFINKSKLVIHYIINHKKDYCGICRYFVADPESWLAHKKFHLPWTCSQCSNVFDSEKERRVHFSKVHQLVHCRLCYFMLSDNDDYHSHLFQKHNVTNISNRNEDVIWENEYEGSPKFLCRLCTKSSVLIIDFFRHYMCFHRFTLKCFSTLLSGNNVPFPVYGANISPGFLASQLHEQSRYGYVDLDQSITENEHKSSNVEEQNSNLLEALIPEIKQENVSDAEEVKSDREDDTSKVLNEELMKYKGEEDFDITLTELIVMRSFYYDYIESALKDIECNKVHKVSSIDYTLLKTKVDIDIDCPVCSDKNVNIVEFVLHAIKMHYIKTSPTYFCRVCTMGFDNESDYQSHVFEEMHEFDNLWLCQFCDKEFKDREETREHLNQHFDSLEYDNCCSPHLGMKCRYCPTLFWSEPEREMHHNEAHYDKHKEDFYKCSLCDEIFSDKVWYTHHYWKHKQQEKSESDTEVDVPLYLFKCNICCFVLSKMDDLRVHFKIDHPEATKIYCCLDPCKFKPLSHSKSFKLHVKSMHGTKPANSKVQEVALSCTVCGREFSNAKAIGTHMTLAHGPGRFKCKFCSDTMQSSDERKLHYLVRHPGQYHFECTICGKSFQYKSSLYIHRADQHSTNKVTYTCEYCNKQFNKKDSFREHVQIHEGPRHACSYCPMRFVQRSNMLRHERRHTGERPYTCTHCGRSFADKGACNSHTRIHSRDTIFPCVYCGQTFVQKSKLKYHLRKHTGEDLETCPVCSKLFTNTYSLREHLKTHEQKTSALCPICNKRYADEKSIIRHIRRMHSDSSPQVCPVCGKTLSTLVGLRQHILTHSKLKQFQCLSCSKAYSIKKSMIKHLRKRHNVKGDRTYTRQYYKQLDAWDCQLGLDDNLLASIFGKPKHVGTDVAIENFITFPGNNPAENVKVKMQSDSGGGNGGGGGDGNEDGDENDDDDDEESNGKGDDTDGGSSTGADELEPPSFVSVKIEPREEDDDDDDEQE